MKKEKIKIEFLVHDMKVPLAVIEAGIISLLERQEKYGKLTKNQEKVLRRVLRNTRTTKLLVEDTLEIGRSKEGVINLKNFRISHMIEQSLVEIFDLADCNASEKIRICHDLYRLRKELAKIGITLTVDEDLWSKEIRLDEVKVRQIFRNLLNNALKYRKERVELEIDQKDGCLILSVGDDGKGIPNDYHKKIFDCYFQMDPEDTDTVRGHGVGLAGAMVLVGDMGGELSLESDKGKGAKFCMRVPLGEDK
jgi:two-component system OmpR family sensor kinase